VGQTSLGNYIFSGLQTRNLDAVLVGCVAAAALALLLDGLVRLVATGHGEGRRARLAAGALGLLALAAWALGAWAAGERDARASVVRIGAKTFTEQYVLAQILAVEYTGTIWATLMHRSDAGAGRAAVLAAVRRWLEETHGVGIAAELGFENTYAFAMRRREAEALGIRTLGDLAPHARRLRAAGDYEFWSRPEWKAVRAAYGIDFAEKRSMDPSLMYAAVARGQVDVITAFSTDGRIDAFDLVTLVDDRGAIPPYDAVVLVGPGLPRRRPEVVAAFARLGGTIDAARMRELNRAVDEDGRAPAAVAREFLAERRLLR
jgi:osmoprotectant transport system permease protein